jgi:beta-glucosidase
MHSTSIVAGMDLEMPFGEFMGDPLLQAVQNGTIAESYVDDSVLRTLTQMFAIGLFDEINPNVRANNGSSVEHVDLARHLSVQSTVLLKNDVAPPPADRQNDDPAPLLPLNINDPLLTLAVLGWADRDSCFTVGNGSGEVNPTRIVSPLEALVARFGGDESRVLFQPNISDIAAATALAQRSTVSIIFVGEQSREGHDRLSLSIRAPGDDLIAAVVKAQPRTIVVMASPGAILTPWRNAVPAILCNFMPGQEVGNAIFDILFGDANPSGKLPITMPIGENDQKFTPSQYPGLPTALPRESSYTEGPFFGYRWYQQNSVQPAFPFGHGLSYTKFEYTNLVIAHRVATFNVTNIGSIAGAEVPQLYLHFPANAPPPMPLWQLRGFAKVQLAPHESITVQLPLTDDRWLSTWYEKLHAWQFVHGEYEVAIGASSEDFRLTGTFQV